jgi:uncharacterized protein YuzE
MKISYDKEANALYIELKQGKFDKNKKIDDFTILDLDKEGNILGIEFLDVDKRMSKEDLAKIYVKNITTIAS